MIEPAVPDALALAGVEPPNLAVPVNVGDANSVALIFAHVTRFVAFDAAESTSGTESASTGVVFAV